MHSELFCKSSIGRRHLLKEPKILPCNNVVCSDCILSNMGKTKIFKCNFPNCIQPHFVENLDALPIHTDSIKILEINLKEFTAERVEELKNTIEKVKETSIESEYNNENYVNMIFDDIDIRVESLKYECDTISDKLKDAMDFIISENMTQLTNLQRIKKKLKKISSQNSLKSVAKQFIKKYHKVDTNFELNRKFVQTAKDEINLTEKTTQSYSYKITNLESIFKSLRVKKQVLDEEIKRFSLVNFEFNPSNRIIGYFVNNTLFTEDDLNRRNFETHIFSGAKELWGLCSIDYENLILTDRKADKIFSSVDFKEFIPRKVLVNSIRLKSPTGICTDHFGYLFLCNHDLNQVLIFDKDFKRLVNVLTGCNKKKFDCPIAVSTCSDTLYVLDRGNKSVHLFTNNGIFIKSFQPLKTDDNRKLIPLSFPLNISVIYGLIAISNMNKLYLYNFKHELIQEIDQPCVSSFCFANRRLLTYNNEGQITCYVEEYDEKHQRVIMCKSHSKRFETLKQTQVAFMAIFNEKLVMTEKNKKMLIVV